jgi:heme-degrading monooxygenase HmoA
MFIAMNRFRVKKGAEGAFENVWTSRESYLDRVPGFVEFHLLKGPEAEDHTLYASDTVWQTKAAFEAWMMGYSTKRSNRHFLRAMLSRSISSLNHTTVRHKFSIPALRSLANGG